MPSPVTKKQKQKKTAAKSVKKPRVSSKSAPLAKSVTVQQYTDSRKPLTVTRREFVTELIQTDVWTLRSFVINPGVDTSFPWLSALANLYEEYKIRSLRYHYVPRCSATSNGSICMAIEQDVTDPDPISVAQLCAYSGAMSGNYWAELMLTPSAKDLAARTGNLFVRTGNPLNFTDVRLNDFGRLYISTSGGTVGAAAGQLWVEYTIDFFVPQLDTIVQDLSVSAPKDVVGGVLGSPQGIPYTTGGVLLQNMLEEYNKLQNKTAEVNSLFTRVTGMFDMLAESFASLPSSTKERIRSASKVGVDPTWVISSPHDWEGYLDFSCCIVAEAYTGGNSQFNGNSGYWGYDLLTNHVVNPLVYSLARKGVDFTGFPDIGTYTFSPAMNWWVVTPTLTGAGDFTPASSKAVVVQTMESIPVSWTSAGAYPAANGGLPTYNGSSPRYVKLDLAAGSWVAVQKWVKVYVKCSKGDVLSFEVTPYNVSQPFNAVYVLDGLTSSEGAYTNSNPEMSLGPVSTTRDHVTGAYPIASCVKHSLGANARGNANINVNLGDADSSTRSVITPSATCCCGGCSGPVKG